MDSEAQIKIGCINQITMEQTRNRKHRGNETHADESVLWHKHIYVGREGDRRTVSAGAIPNDIRVRTSKIERGLSLSPSFSCVGAGSSFRSYSSSCSGSHGGVTDSNGCWAHPTEEEWAAAARASVEQLAEDSP